MYRIVICFKDEEDDVCRVERGPWRKGRARQQAHMVISSGFTLPDEPNGDEWFYGPHRVMAVCVSKAEDDGQEG